jgi:hypothetical protein
MSISADHLVVPYSVFLERRERLAGLATALRELDAADAAPPAAPTNASADPAPTPPTADFPLEPAHVRPR